MTARQFLQRSERIWWQGVSTSLTDELPAGYSRRGFVRRPSELLAMYPTADDRDFKLLGIEYGSRPASMTPLPGPRYPWPLRAGIQCVVAPWWLITFAAACVPGLWFWRSIHRSVHRWQVKARTLRGECPHCRYDLRASKGRCPECGAPIPAVSEGRTGVPL